jgi:hypothetical protein
MGRTRALIRKYQLGSLLFRLRIGALARPNYAYLLWVAARQAKALKMDSFSVLEYGVAGGNGLVALEELAIEVEKLFDIKIEIYGFDTGEGLPAPLDYRDLPYHWKAGFFKMDVPALQSRLKKAKLVLGNVSDTGAKFFKEWKPAPGGAMIHDFDYYSSTCVALKMLQAERSNFLPRVTIYFDDTNGSDQEMYCEFTGQRLAIAQFNLASERTKLGQPSHLIAKARAAWHHQIWVAHLFDHAQYNTFVSIPNQQLPLN